MDVCDWKYIKNLLLEMEGENKNYKLIHLRYPDGLLSDRELIDYKERFKREGIMLSSFKIKESDLAFIHLRSVPLRVVFYVDEEIINDILLGKTETIKLDVFKEIVIETYTRIRENYNDNYIFISTCNLKLVLQFNVGANACYNFRFHNGLSKVNFSVAFNEIYDLLGEIRADKDLNSSNNVDYDYLKNSWVRINSQKVQNSLGQEKSL
jgi:hypothetical protein